MSDQADTSNNQDERTGGYGGSDPASVPGEQTGGYGGSTGGQDPAAARTNPAEDVGTSNGTSAVGRNNPANSPIDADEALGNRAGG